MKKVLLATTALALSAGVASAEITLSGSARMGLVYAGDVAGKDAVAGTAFTSVSAVNAATGATLFSDDTAAEQNATLKARRALLVAAAGTGLDLGDQAENAAQIEAIDAALADIGTADAVAAKDSTIVFDNRIQLNIDASTETSSGLTFGARTRVRINENETGALNAPRVYVKSGAVEVAMGNIYGALDSMTGMYDSEVGLTALSDAGVVIVPETNGGWNFDGYSSQGTGANGVEVIYSAGAFTGHLSYSDSDLGSNADRVAAYGAYTMNDWTVALGMQDSQDNTEDKTVLTIGGNLGDYHVGFAAADNDGVSKIALNGSATFGATTVNGFVADDESGTDTALGLGVSYDLGGASVMAGVERDAVGQTRADMGVSFSF